ncbi:hypothetical protein HDK77DRAFT_432577 [Phyllosticta capitalensis]
MESEKYRALFQGTGDWEEKRENKITIMDEDPKLFRSFAKYLYYDNWTYQNDNEESIVHLARLYCLGDRLVAKRFQESVLWRFDLELRFPFEDENVSDDDLCDILEVAFSELPERPDVDPLQRRVARLGASRLFDLQKYPRFRDELSKDVPGITRRMCLCMAPMELRDLEKERLLQNKRKTTARGVKCDNEEKQEHPPERFYT